MKNCNDNPCNLRLVWEFFIKKKKKNCSVFTKFILFQSLIRFVTRLKSTLWKVKFIVLVKQRYCKTLHWIMYWKINIKFNHFFRDMVKANIFVTLCYIFSDYAIIHGWFRIKIKVVKISFKVWRNLKSGADLSVGFDGGPNFICIYLFVYNKNVFDNKNVWKFILNIKRYIEHKRRPPFLCRFDILYGQEASHDL